MGSSLLCQPPLLRDLDSPQRKERRPGGSTRSPIIQSTRTIARNQSTKTAASTESTWSNWSTHSTYYTYCTYCTDSFYCTHSFNYTHKIQLCLVVLARKRRLWSLRNVRFLDSQYPPSLSRSTKGSQEILHVRSPIHILTLRDALPDER